MIRKRTLLVLFGITLGLMVFLHFVYDPIYTFVHVITHLTAILGIVSLFFAILIPLLKKHLSLPKPQKLITLHHFFSYMAWFSMVTHMLFLIIKFNKWEILLPSFVPWYGIFIKGGPIAFILFGIASAGLLFRKRWKTFKAIHSVNIVAFFWISSHGILKDNGIKANYPQYVLLILLDLIILAFLIKNDSNRVNSPKKKISKKKEVKNEICTA